MFDNREQKLCFHVTAGPTVGDECYPEDDIPQPWILKNDML